MSIFRLIKSIFLLLPKIFTTDFNSPQPSNLPIYHLITYGSYNNIYYEKVDYNITLTFNPCYNYSQLNNTPLNGFYLQICYPNNSTISL